MCRDASTATVPPLGTPPFPDHPAGHGCVSGATLYAAQEFFGTDEVEPTGRSRGRMAVQTFGLTVVAIAIGLVLLALLLYGLGAVAMALWNHWWSDFA